MTQFALLTSITMEGIATITLNRPERHNAFDDVLITELTTTLQQLEETPNLRALILRANGKHFCAGADANWMRRMVDYTAAENLRDAHQLAELMNTLYHFSKPTIALAHGAAYGGGIGLIACCDIALATHSAQFCFSEVKLGLVPATISPYVIAAIGERAARYYFLTAERFDAKNALTLGLIRDVVAEDELITKGEALASQLLINAPQAIAAAKQLVTSVAGQPIDATLRSFTAECIATLRSTPEAQEGLKAFLEKRPPAWSLK